MYHDSQYYLIRFQHKYSCRRLLRRLSNSSGDNLLLSNLAPSLDNLQIKCSSIYKIPNLTKHYYLLIKTNNKSCNLLADISALSLNSEITIIFPEGGVINPVIKTLFEWAYSEIEQRVEFIEIESKTTLINELGNIGGKYNYGRQLVVNDFGTYFIVMRTFDYLAEIFGIINYTSDSFSDGGLYNSVDLVCTRVAEHLANNVNIIDLGVESTRPNAVGLTAEMEIKRLNEVLPAILSLRCNAVLPFKISIDTYHAETMLFLSEMDIDIINDVSGMVNSAVIKDLIMNGKKYVAMHCLTVPANKNKILELHCDPVEHIYKWMQQRLEKLMKDCEKSLTSSILQESIIFDVGIGFGNNAVQAWYILKKLNKFRHLPCEILLGHSRKSLFNHVGNNAAKDRDLETAIVALQVMPYVDYLRVHDVQLLNRTYALRANL